MSSRLRGLALLAALGTLHDRLDARGRPRQRRPGRPAARASAGSRCRLVLNAALFFAAFRLLTDALRSRPRTLARLRQRDAAVDVLQAVGGAYIGHVVKGAGPPTGRSRR